MPKQVCVLKIEYLPDVLKITEALPNNKYAVKVTPIFKEFPRENDIAHYEVSIAEMVGEGE